MDVGAFGRESIRPTATTCEIRRLFDTRANPTISTIPHTSAT